MFDMVDAAERAFIRVWKDSERTPADLHAAALLASAVLGSNARRVTTLHPNAWAQANLLARDPNSLINTTPAAPARKQHG